MEDLKGFNLKQLKDKSKVQLLKLAKSLNLVGLSRVSKSRLMERIVKSLEGSLGVRKVNPEWGGSYSSVELTQYRPSPLPSSIESEIAIPKGYGRTEIRVLVQSSRWIYCYWEIVHESDSLLLSLRVYNVSEVDLEKEESNFYYDLSVLNRADHWYIEVPSADHEYIVDLGYWDTEGKFQLLARSNRVYVPREGISEREDPNWLSLENLVSKPSFLSSPEITRNPKNP